MKNGNTKASIKIVLLGILLFGISLRLYEIDEPWIGAHDSSGATNGNAAAFFLEYGLGETGPIIVKGVNSADPLSFNYYINHPPLNQIITYGSYILFGKSEASTRIVPIIFSILSIILTYMIAVKIYGPGPSLLVVLFMAINPIESYYGRLPHMFVATKFFVLLTVYLYILWIRTRNRLYYPFIVLTLLLGLFTDWPAYFLPPALLLYHLLVEGKRGIAFPVILNFVAFLAFAAFMLAVMHYTDSYGLHELMRVYEKSEIAKDFSFLSVFWKNGYYILLYYSVGWILLVLAYFCDLLGMKLKPKSTADHRMTREQKGVLLILFIVGTLNIALFPKHSINHEHWMEFYSPFLALLGGFAGSYLYSSGKWRRGLVIILVSLFAAQSLFIYARRQAQHDYFPLTIEMAKSVKNLEVDPVNTVYLTPFLVSNDIFLFYSGSRIIRINNIESIRDLDKKMPGVHFRYISIDSESAREKAGFFSAFSESDLKIWGLYKEGEDPLVKGRFLRKILCINGFYLYSVHLNEQPAY
ncbi:MAG: glycosyltransferase family 39 protein [Deltaproteobacteria bacterium]|uniref:Glycosyltransferase family 39 protein n=1 Tax=Candidatus Zymogenus saltonus TaxID=2844893 RepID=A0A9D8KGZ2_9DELT|nr:glycosyltransferase family 39 protein [Candidatus Zymogenus saltonus]